MVPQLQLAGSAVVITAHQFNPSIFNSLWLVKHGVLSEDELGSGNIFTDEVSQVQTAKFQLTIFPPQLQLVPMTPWPEDFQYFTERLGKIVRALPETPYSAVGLNFVWHLSGVEVTIATRELFLPKQSPVAPFFGADDAQFGAYMSKKWHDFRLKLDIKPVSIQSPQPASSAIEHQVQFGFNFHCDVNKSDKPAQIVRLLEQWSAAVDYAAQITRSVIERLGG